jgi:hypothetical protein
MSRIPQWVFDQVPWLKDAVPILVALQTFWHDYSSLIILLGFFYVLRRLRQERVKLGERIDTLGLIVRATRDEAEASIGLPPPLPSAPSPQSLERATPPVPGFLPPPLSPTEQTAPGDVSALATWETIRLGWRDVRDRLELLIEGIRHARVRGKYSRIPRYTYREVINALQRDGEIASAQVADRLRNMDTTFNILKFRPRTVTGSDVAQFNSDLEFVDPYLPRLPDEAGGLPPAQRAP